MTDIYLLQLNDFDIVRNHWNTLINSVSSEKRDRLERTKNFDDAARSLVAEVLLRSLIRQHLGIRNGEIVFQTGRYGKPFLSGTHKNALHFNISHSGSWIALSISDCENGIDIQEMRSIPNVTNKHAFFEAWVLKEARLKCLGVGILGKLDDTGKLHCQSFFPDEQTKAAVCAVNDGFSKPELITLETLLKNEGESS